MKINLRQLFIIGTTSLLLTGCYTAGHAKLWEYKVAAPGNQYSAHSQSEIQQMFLNDMGKDGWIFVQKDVDGDFIFRRLKR